MSATVVVALAFGATTVGLAYYVWVLLPRNMAARLAESMMAFSTAVELRFPSHKGMTVRVVRLSEEVAARLGMGRDEARRLAMAAVLRDIGLCSVSFRLGNGKHPLDWTPAEAATYERHPEAGGAMLELIPSLRYLANIVRCHHANFDGSSGDFYPARHDIPRESRVLNVVASYVWNERMLGGVLAYDALVRGSGMEFDPEVVAAFRDVLTSSRVAEPQLAVSR